MQPAFWLFVTIEISFHRSDSYEYTINVVNNKNKTDKQEIDIDCEGEIKPLDMLTIIINNGSSTTQQPTARSSQLKSPERSLEQLPCSNNTNEFNHSELGNSVGL